MEKIKVDGNIMSREEQIVAVCIHIVMIIVCSLSLFAFLIIVGSSFQSQDEIYSIGYRVLPVKSTLDAYKYIFGNMGRVLDAYKITFITSFVGTIGGLWVTASYGYVLSRKDYPYRKILSVFILFTMLFNGGMVARYIVNSTWLHLRNTIWILILPLMLSPWNTMIMKSFFSGIPSDLIEAAKIDGAGEFRIYTRIILPMSKPILAAVSLFLLLAYWNDYYYSLLYIETPSLQKLQYLLMTILTDMSAMNNGLSGEAEMTEQMMASLPVESAKMAMCVIAAGPILFVFPFFQRFFVKGMSVGAVKG